MWRIALNVAIVMQIGFLNAANNNAASKGSTRPKQVETNSLMPNFSQFKIKVLPHPWKIDQLYQCH